MGVSGVNGGNSGGGGSGAIVGGSTVGGLQPLRTTLHTISISLRNSYELQQNCKALGALNARWALTVYPVFEDEKLKASDKKLVKRKIA